MGGFHGQNPQLFKKGKREDLALDAYRAAHAVRHGGWLEEILGGGQSPGSFINAASITDAVNLGTVALRARKKVLFDSENMKITNDSGANKYLVRECREGWRL